MTSIFESFFPQNKAQTQTKTRGPIWVPGISITKRFIGNTRLSRYDNLLRLPQVLKTQ